MKPYNTWIEISESAYANNLKFFRSFIGSETELAVVVKANAYGHGWRQIARLAVQHGADSFCVHSLEEALKLRKAGHLQDVLIMGHVPLAHLSSVIEEDFRLVVFNRETILKLRDITGRLQRPVRIHLKLETGTYRQGIDSEALSWFLQTLRETPAIILESVYTHFANIEDTSNQEYATRQMQRFREMVETIQAAGFPGIKKHTACTAAALLFPETHYDMIRLGIGQYGFWPSLQTLVSYKETSSGVIEGKLQPLLTWKTRVSQIKPVPAEHTIGYGRTYQTTRDSRVAVLPVGYSDGYDRGLSNQAYVLIGGKRAPVRGRICMNLMMVDITDIPGVRLEDEVVLLGRQEKEQVTADYLAGLCDTIHYEIVARINPEIPRVIVR